jgi:hypothetical protein
MGPAGSRAPIGPESTSRFEDRPAGVEHSARRMVQVLQPMITTDGRTLRSWTIDLCLGEDTVLGQYLGETV